MSKSTSGRDKCHEENKIMKWDRGTEYRDTSLYRLAGSLSTKVAFELNNKQESHETFWRKNIPGRGQSKWKESGLGMILVHLTVEVCLLYHLLVSPECPWRDQHKLKCEPYCRPRHYLHSPSLNIFTLHRLVYCRKPSGFPYRSLSCAWEE